MNFNYSEEKPAKLQQDQQLHHFLCHLLAHKTVQQIIDRTSLVQTFSTPTEFARSATKNRKKVLVNTPYLLAKTFAATNKSSIIASATYS